MNAATPFAEKPDDRVIETLFSCVGGSQTVMALNTLEQAARAYPTLRDPIVARLKTMAAGGKNGKISAAFNGDHSGEMHLTLLRIQDADNFLLGRDSLPLNALQIIPELKTAINRLSVLQEHENCIAMVVQIAASHLARSTIDKSDQANFQLYQTLVKIFSHPEDRPITPGSSMTGHDFQVEVLREAAKKLSQLQAKAAYGAPAHAPEFATSGQ